MYSVHINLLDFDVDVYTTVPKCGELLTAPKRGGRLWWDNSKKNEGKTFWYFFGMYNWSEAVCSFSMQRWYTMTIIGIFYTLYKCVVRIWDTVIMLIRVPTISWLIHKKWISNCFDNRVIILSHFKEKMSKFSGCSLNVTKCVSFFSCLW